MRVLTVSDQVVEALHSPALLHYASGVEAILSCGDLPAAYLEYLVSMLNVPINAMRARIAALTPALMLNKARDGRYLDILLTHAPPHKIHDSDDYAHRGFKSFVWFIEHYQPRYLIHGHMHVYDKRAETITVRGGTTIVNAYGYKCCALCAMPLTNSWKAKRQANGRRVPWRTVSPKRGDPP